jgi:hypothetical protein
MRLWSSILERVFSWNESTNPTTQSSKYRRRTIACSTMPRIITQKLWRLLRIAWIVGPRSSGKKVNHIPKALPDNLWFLKQEFLPTQGQGDIESSGYRRDCQKNHRAKKPNRGKWKKKSAFCSPNRKKGKAVSY